MTATGATPTSDRPFNLFVYGTLTNPSVFRAVLGRRPVSHADEADGTQTVLAREAVLDRYTKVSPDNTYLYAVPAEQGRIRGFVVGPLPRECLSALRRYEGRNYRRKRVRVQTKDGPVEAIVFTGNLEQLAHTFGYRFRDPFKQEILLQEKIEAALLETEREQLHTDEILARRAVGELHGPVIRDLVRVHFEREGISDYAIRQSLRDEPLRDYTDAAADPEAVALAPNYLALVVRQVLFNQIEERIRGEFRWELDEMADSEKYYERAISSLAALRVLNGNPELLDALVGDCLGEVHFETDHLVDFVRWAVVAAEEVHDANLARAEIDFIRTHLGRGSIPLGVELEFSNIGQDVIHDPAGEDQRELVFDGFLYFSDFGLDALTWKLGGHVDDHLEKAPGRRRRGFFEVAPGNLSIEANISKPLTTDPWMLNQFIHQVRRFYPIAPHSVHISMQLRRQQRPDRNRLLPLGVLKCLFAIAGDPVGADGQVRIRRLVSDEIIHDGPPASMLFSEVAMRRSKETGQPVPGTPSGGRFVQQFRFLRLSPELNYEPITVALKGLQLSLRPGTFLTPEQWRTSGRHRNRFERLLEWGRNPRPLRTEDVELFLGRVYDGLMGERRGRPAHSEAYVAWALEELQEMCCRFNDLLTGTGNGDGPD